MLEIVTKTKDISQLKEEYQTVYKELINLMEENDFFKEENIFLKDQYRTLNN